MTICCKMKLNLANCFFLSFWFLPLNMSLAKCLHTKYLKKKGFPLAIDILRKVYIVSSAILLD